MSGGVHGFGTDLVAPDWPSLTGAEVGAVLAAYPFAGSAVIRWRSPRPLSSAALVRTRAGTVFVKRHRSVVRSVADLAEEHAFGDHLRGRGVVVPAVLRTSGGATAVAAGPWTYEVHAAAAGVDLYRDAPSWTPPRSVRHAYAAGVALARLHGAAASYGAPARRARLLTGSFVLFAGGDPVGAIRSRLAGRPLLAAALAGRAWEADVRRLHLPYQRRYAGRWAELTPLWTHGDWHVSNLLWTAGGTVGGVFDLGLADRTTAVVDLAIALERNAFPWLERATGPMRPRLDVADALLAGYLSARPLSAAERAVLPDLLPVVHAEFALAEVEYYAGVVGNAASAEVAYTDYFLGHTAWFGTPAGRAAVQACRRMVAGELMR